ncbi:MAG: hypothetical protein K2H23_00365 [Oscillospiraceae bacterium]|nr:hypothetical protein [Oscillospiraceae bacterium]
MKLKKILAAVAAAAVAVSTMAVSAFAIDKGDYFDGSTLYLVADDGKPQWAVDNNVDVTEIYGYKVYATFNGGEVADESVWIGGGIGANSNSTGWKQIEWGRSGKEVIADLANGTITWQSSTPIFKADDKYVQLWIQTWGGTVTYDKVEILDANGNVIEGSPAAPAADETSDDDASAEADAPAADEATPAPTADDDADVVDDADDDVDVDDVDVDVDDADDDVAPATTEEAAPAVTEAPVADTNTAAAATGNVAVASIIAVMAVAGTAAIVAKKRK